MEDDVLDGIVDEEDISFDDIPICIDSLIDGECESDNIVSRKSIKRSRKIQALFAFVSALLICLQLYIDYFMYSPEERELSDDNLFSGNSLIISDEEVEEIVADLEDRLGVTIDEDLKDEYCVLNAITENDNLSVEQKNLFYKFINIIKDTPYLDREAAYSSLLNVEISYKNRPFSFKKNVEGVYIHTLESIGIFVDDPEYRVLIHEIIHCIFCNDDTFNLPAYFKEGMTELLANEYFSDDPFVELSNYPFEVAVVKMLCEVASADAVLEAYCTGDMGIIAREIAKVTGDEDGATKALDMLDYAIRRFNDELEDDEEVIEDGNTIINGFIPLFRTCIEAKCVPESHFRVSYYYNELLFINIFKDKPYDGYVDDLLEYGVDYKAYFSTELRDSLLKKGGTLQKNNEAPVTFIKEFGTVNKN